MVPLAMLLPGRGAPRVSFRMLSTCALLRSPAPLDTSHLVARLQDAGVSEAQADSLASGVRDAVAQSLETVERDLVSRPDAEKWRFARKTDFAQLKSEMQLLEHNDFAVMKTAHERLMSDIERVKVKLREDITRTQAGVRLDLHLEKGRIRDESSVHALKIKEIETRIEAEIAQLRTEIQSARFSVMQYLFGVMTGAAALLLAYLRMFT